MLIGRDRNGHSVIISRVLTEENEVFCVSSICCINGDRLFGLISPTMTHIQNFPDLHSIWRTTNYDYDTHAKRMRIHTAAVHHAVEMGE